MIASQCTWCSPPVPAVLSTRALGTWWGGTVGSPPVALPGPGLLPEAQRYWSHDTSGSPRCHAQLLGSSWYRAVGRASGQRGRVPDDRPRQIAFHSEGDT